MSEITVASTTDTQRAVELAAGLNNESAVPEVSQVQSETGSQQEYSDALDGIETTATTDAADEGGEQQIPRSARNDKDKEGNDKNKEWNAKGEPPKTRTQKQLEALTQRAYEQQEELDTLRNQVAGNRSQGTAQPNDGRPTPTQYGSYDEFIEALADWKAGQRLQQQRQAELVQAEQARTREAFDTYNAAAKSARAKYGDFEEVVGRRDLKIPQAAQVAIIEAGNAGPDIAYYLGKHPEVCGELAGMSPMRAISRIGQIEAEVTGKRGQVTGNREQRKALPAPITPVGGSSSRSSVPLGELPYRDYKRLRDQEERGLR